MIKQVVKDTFFLGQKSEIATKQDLAVGQDLQDTLTANRERCVGMAANMIGVRKRIIIVNMGLMNMVMYNPIIVKKDTPYETEEGCLSLEGVRKTTRFDDMMILSFYYGQKMGYDKIKESEVIDFLTKNV